MSAVDGYTLPFTATVTDNTTTDANEPCENSDCSNRAYSQCPTFENLSVGQSGAVDNSYASVDLVLQNGSGETIGCYSPCKALNYPTYGGKNLSETSSEAIMYCCPAGITSEECRAGPIVSTEYVSRVHTMCSNTAYAYSYDDTYGLRYCSAASKIHVTFGPNCP